MVCFSSVTLLNGVSKFVGYLKAKDTLVERELYTEDMRVQTFPKGSNLKVNEIEWLEFKLPYYYEV